MNKHIIILYIISIVFIILYAIIISHFIKKKFKKPIDKTL